MIPFPADSYFPVSLPVMTMALPGAQTRSPPTHSHPARTSVFEFCWNSLSVLLELLDSHRQAGVDSYSYEKCCSVSEWKRHVGAEDKDSPIPSKSGLTVSKPWALLTSFHPSLMTWVWGKQEGVVAIWHGKKGLAANAIWFRDALLHKILWRSSNVPQANAYILRLVTL